jgi:hypothetical protein
VFGTPAFMAPEQAAGRASQVDARTDIWSVGATMFTLLSGELVHIAESSSEHLVKAATAHARSVARVLPGVPANVETLISRALRFEKRERWASATEMRRELWRVRLDPGRPIGTTSAPPPRNPSSAFPTVVGKRDSDKSGLRETGMSLSGAPRVPDPRSRRAVFVSTAFAILLVASALTFGIYMAIRQGPQLARPAAAAMAEKTPPLVAGAADGTGVTDSVGSDTLPLPAVTTTTPFGDTAARPATTGVPTTTGATVTGAKGAATAAAAKPTSTAVSAPPKTTASAGKRGPSPAPTGDLYRPF